MVWCGSMKTCLLPDRVTVADGRLLLMTGPDAIGYARPRATVRQIVRRSGVERSPEFNRPPTSSCQRAQDGRKA